MNLLEAKNLAISLMDEHGLLDNRWYFEFDNAKRRFGCCNYTHKRITLSKALVSLNGEARVKNTILHEIAHALVGNKHGHDHVWRMKAREIGCDGERCYSSLEVERPKGNYEAICPICNHKHYKFKRPNLQKKASCGVCSRSYNPKSILIFNPIR